MEKMAKEQARAEAEALSLRLSELQHQYYVLGRPEVDDLEYDRLFDRLVALESAHPELKTPYSPTNRVGSDLSNELPEVTHSIPVLSLDKAYSPEELLAWGEKTAKNADGPLTAVVEEKMDGVSIVLYFENGVLARAVTRGNGTVGNDVTANIRTIRSLPLRLAEAATVAVRGEIFLPKPRFEEINLKLEEPYANPRNLAAGSIRRIKSSEVAAVPLEIYCYEGFFTPPMDSHLAALARLKRLGFPLNPFLAVLSESPREFSPEVRQAVEILGAPVTPWSALPGIVAAEAAGRASLSYEIDGLVLKADDLALRERLGYTGHHPRWALAFKFESPQGVTSVEEIFVQVGRTGRVTPVGRVKPVQVGGSTISFVTLHNQSYIEQLELGIGDQVVISRRGDVIPAVERVVEKLSEHVWNFPRVCPCCATPLILDGAHHFCPNPDCGDQKKGRLVFFVGKGQMDMENLGPETLEVLYSKGLVREISDLYTCDFDQLLDEPGFGPKKVALIKEGVEASRRRPFQTVLASLGVPDLGKKLAELLIESGFRSMDAILEALKTPEALLGIPGIGEKTILNLRKELLDPRTLDLIAGLKSAGLAFEAPESAQVRSRAFEGTAWCVTGSFEAFNPRSLAEKEIKARSGRVVSAVSGQTTHLLAGEKAGSKLQKARELGVQVVTEMEFLDLLKLHTL